MEELLRASSFPWLLPKPRSSNIYLLRAETAAGSSIDKGEEAILWVAILEVCSGQSAATM